MYFKGKLKSKLSFQFCMSQIISFCKYKFMLFPYFVVYSHPFKYDHATPEHTVHSEYTVQSLIY